MKAGVKTKYTAFLSKQDEIKINETLRVLSVGDLERIVEFLEVTLDNAKFPLEPDSSFGNTLISNEIPTSEYISNGLSKEDVVFAMGWLTQNTPIRRLQPSPHTSFNRGYANKVGVAISFNDLDIARQILPIIQTIQKTTINALSYDDKKLYIKGFCVEICKGASSREDWLLKTIFKDKNKKWYTDELADEDLGSDVTTADYKTKKYYKYARRINEKVAVETGIRDFIDNSSTKYLQINTEYLT